MNVCGAHDEQIKIRFRQPGGAGSKICGTTSVLSLQKVLGRAQRLVSSAYLDRRTHHQPRKSCIPSLSAESLASEQHEKKRCFRIQTEMLD